MTLKIDNAIEEIERALAGNKPKYVNDIYLNNAIRYLQEIKSPSLTDDQQVVLEWLKSNQQKEKYPTVAIVNMLDIDENNACFYAIENLSIEQEFQVLAAFAEWGNKSNE